MTSPIDRAREAAARAYQTERGKWRVSSIPDNIAMPLTNAAIDAFLSALSAEGMVVVREAVLAEKIARLMCGFDLSPDNMVPISNPNDSWGDPVGEQTMWEANMPGARAMIAAASQGEGT